MLEPYGVDAPIEGMVIGVELVNDAVPAEGGFTVSKNAALALKGPSVTVTVIVAIPVCPADGLIVTVRLDAEPPKTMLPSGTSAGLDELPLNCRFDGAISASPTVKAI